MLFTSQLKPLIVSRSRIGRGKEGRLGNLALSGANGQPDKCTFLPGYKVTATRAPPFFSIAQYLWKG